MNLQCFRKTSSTCGGIFVSLFAFFYLEVLGNYVLECSEGTFCVTKRKLYFLILLYIITLYNIINYILYVCGTQPYLEWRDFINDNVAIMCDRDKLSRPGRNIMVSGYNCNRQYYTKPFETLKLSFMFLKNDRFVKYFVSKKKAF